MEIDNENETPSTAVSLYGDSSDAMDDFPILKAFQEYVDKEQAKARHRMTVMTILFMFVLFMVAGGLSFVIYNLNLRNQALNDRLIDFAMKEREVPAQVSHPVATPPVVVQPPQDNSALVAMVESLKTLIQEQKASAAPAAAPTIAPAEPQGPSPEQLLLEKKLKEQQERIEKTAALLKAQEEAIAAQKAQLREQELEAYRRKHYPEYYQRLEQQQIQQEFADEVEPVAVKKPQPKPSKPAVKRPKILEVVEDIEVEDDELEDMLDTDEEIDDIESDDDDFEDYYNEDDEDYSIPVDSGANWLIPKE